MSCSNDSRKTRRWVPFSLSKLYHLGPFLIVQRGTTGTTFHCLKQVRAELAFRAGEMKTPAITLPPKSVTLLDAMAEAAGLPRKRGEATIDLSSFTTPSGNNQPQTVGK